MKAKTRQLLTNPTTPISVIELPVCFLRWCWLLPPPQVKSIKYEVNCEKTAWGGTGSRVACNNLKILAQNYRRLLQAYKKNFGDRNLLTKGADKSIPPSHGYFRIKGKQILLRVIKHDERCTKGCHLTFTLCPHYIQLKIIFRELMKIFADKGSFSCDFLSCF